MRVCVGGDKIEIIKEEWSHFEVERGNLFYYSDEGRHLVTSGFIYANSITRDLCLVREGDEVRISKIEEADEAKIILRPKGDLLLLAIDPPYKGKFISIWFEINESMLPVVNRMLSLVEPTQRGPLFDAYSSTEYNLSRRNGNKKQSF